MCLKNKIHSLLFILLNGILTASPVIIFYFFEIIFANININLFKQMISFIFLILFLLFKFLIFPFIYKNSSNESFYKEFFGKLDNNMIFSLKIFILAFIIDILTISLLGMKQNHYSVRFFSYYLIIFYIIGLGGLSFSYLAMILWLKVKKYNISAVVAAVSAIISLIQFGYFIYIKGLNISGFLLFLPAIFIFVINYPFQKEENSSAFSKNLIGILNFIVLILVQTVFLSLILLTLN